MKRFLLAALLAFVLGASGAFAAEQDPAKVVTVKGEAAINNDLAAAKERAKEAALREAVNQVVGATVTSVSEMQDYTLVRDIVFSQTAGYVSEYNLVSEQVDQEYDLVTATYQVKVAKGEIDKDAAAIAALMAMKKQNSIHLMVRDVSTETVGEGSAKSTLAISHGVFEGELRNSLKKDGFFVADANLNLASGKLKSDGPFQAVNNPQEARELGITLGVQLVVYGTVVVTNSVEKVYEQELHAAVLRASLVAVAPDSGEVIADYVGSTSASAHTMPQAANRVVAQAAAAASKELRTEIYSAWRKQVTGAQTVIVELSGVNFGDFNAFKDLLEADVRGVKGVNANGFKAGVGRFDVKLVGGSAELAKFLAGKRLRGKTLDVDTLTPNTIGLVLEK
ncbi:MAG TPA: hypothetical protein DFS52_15170 [Myxococcales bacterium]|nr:hypothetical protein [Myxococcales bacterium]